MCSLVMQNLFVILWERAFFWERVSTDSVDHFLTRLCKTLQKSVCKIPITAANERTKSISSWNLLGHVEQQTKTKLPEH